MKKKTSTQGSAAVWIIVIVVILLIGGGLFYYFYQANQVKQAETQALSEIENLPLATPISSAAPTVFPDDLSQIEGDIVGTWTGVSPCADCAGIETTLTLFQNPATGVSPYLMSQTYLGASDVPNVSTGTWTTMRGNAEDPNATIYMIGANNPDSASYYILEADGSLQKADSQQMPIMGANPEDYVLRPAEPIINNS